MVGTPVSNTIEMNPTELHIHLRFSQGGTATVG
jgi:hypothetical protein